MYVNELEKVPKEASTVQGSQGVSLQWLISDKQGAEHFYMRYVTVAPGGVIPLHSHHWVHEIFVAKGQGEGRGGETPVVLKPGTFIFVPSNEEHTFRNTGNTPLEMICCMSRPQT